MSARSEHNTGCAHHVNHDNASFSVTVSQRILGTLPASTLTVHVLVLPTTLWPLPCDCLPIENQVVRFTGELCLVDDKEATVVLDLVQCLPM